MPQNSEDLAKAVIDFYRSNLSRGIKDAMKDNADLFKWTEAKERVVLDLKPGQEI